MASEVTHPQAALRSVTAPKQLRAERTLVRILEAAEELIEEVGIGGASIPEIVRRAGSSVGGFYARFRDKNELLRAIEERFFRELEARVDALADARRWEGAPLEAIVDACVADMIEVGRRRRNLIAAFLHRAVHDPAAREDARKFREEVARRIGALLLSRTAEIRHPAPEIAIDLAVQLALAFMQQQVWTGVTTAGGRELSDAELRAELVRLFLRYAGHDSEAPVRGRARRAAREPRRTAAQRRLDRRRIRKGGP